MSDELKGKIIGSNALWYEDVELLALMLLDEKSMGTHSHYFHYINNLPGVDDFPLFYGQKEKKLLEGSPILSKLEKVEANYGDDYNLLVSFVPNISKYSFE